jgi:hypothetical protein
MCGGTIEPSLHLLKDLRIGFVICRQVTTKVREHRRMLIWTGGVFEVQQQPEFKARLAANELNCNARSIAILEWVPGEL